MSFRRRLGVCHFDAALAAEKSHQIHIDEIPRGVYPAPDAVLGMTILVRFALINVTQSLTFSLEGHIFMVWSFVFYVFWGSCGEVRVIPQGKGFVVQSCFRDETCQASASRPNFAHFLWFILRKSINHPTDPLGRNLVE
jgi:hypothetical protein